MMVTLKLGGGLTSEEGQIRVTDLASGSLTVGRSPEADWTLIEPSNRVSGRHFELFRQGDSVMVVDHSSGGTALDRPGARLQKGQPARLNDTTRLILPVGEVRVSIERHAPEGFVEDTAEQSDYFLVRKMQSERRAGSEPFAVQAPPAATPSRPRRDLPSLSETASESGRRPTSPGGLSAPKPLQAAPKPARERQRRDAPAAPRNQPASFDELIDSNEDPFPAVAADEPERAPEAPHETPGETPPEAPPATRSEGLPEAPPEAPPEGRPGKLPAGLGETATAPPEFAEPAESVEPADDAFEDAREDAADEPRSAPERRPAPQAARESHEASPQAAAGPSDPSDTAALRALFEAVGLDYDDMPAEQRAETAALIGRLVVSMSDVLRRLLDGRRMVKRELGVAGTQVEFGANPLKFAPTTEAAVEGLIRPLASGYITGEEAVSDALSSMQSHQLALVGAIRSAVRVALDAFDPAELERKLETRGLSQMVPALRRAELWERFRADYARFTEQANDDIRMVIGRELDKLYAAPETRTASQGRRGPSDDGDR